jgi:hypothetical protein
MDKIGWYIWNKWNMKSYASNFGLMVFLGIQIVMYKLNEFKWDATMLKLSKDNVNIMAWTLYISHLYFGNVNLFYYNLHRDLYMVKVEVYIWKCCNPWNLF